MIKNIVHFFIIPFFLGVIGGFSAIIFRWLIKIFTMFNEKLNIFQSNYFYLISIPVIFLLSDWLIKKLKISSENVTLDLIAKKVILLKGKFSKIKGFLVLFLTSLSIGFGIPVGREGPIAKLGGLLSEIFLEKLKIEKINFPIYLGAGIASAIAATFNAPVAGAILGLEIIIGKINSYIIIPLIISIVTATFISREFIGNFAAFIVPHLSWNEEYVFFIPFEALFISVLCLIVIEGLEYLRVLKVKNRHYWHKYIVILGLFAGVIISLVPESAGIGYEHITTILNDNSYSVSYIFIILAAKIIGLILSIGSGLFGGIMSPSIFIGSFGGYWFGSVFDFLGIDPRVFAVVGAASMLAGITKTPLRSSVIITELTHSYQLVLPILVASSLTVFLISLIKRDTFFKRSLLQKGIDIENKEIYKFLKNCNLEKYLVKIPAIKEKFSVYRASLLIKKNKFNILAVVDDNGKLIGLITLTDIRKSFLLNKKHLEIKDIMTKNPFVIKTNSSLEDIIRAIGLIENRFVPYTDEKGNYLGFIDLRSLVKDLSITYNSFYLK
ncbi:chloride channel protein, CIC family [Lebetimonas natsushimae]|uniref:Chloride channel protein, CIC family n=1 Tax=Lebetimonas natsushimae TaxID=1936991 RepID=A0A292YFY9_9BACT|nr:chloride channel protein [Lebetimonas natsushimae]GAX87885.1 chloride channel protein, CIC family [Lebetimonas natsushimae]